MEEKKLITKKKLQVVKFSVKKGEALDKNSNTKMEHDRVVGAFVRLSNPDALQGATIRLLIDDIEIIPADTEVALLHHSDDMSINDVAYPVNEKAKNSTIKVSYADNSENLAVGEEYDVRLYLMTEVDVKQ